jgi:hypothetical protein
MIGEKDTQQFRPQAHQAQDGQLNKTDPAEGTAPIVRLAEEFGRATSNIHDAVAQTNAKLQETVQEEIRRSLEQALSGAMAALPSLPTWEALLDILRQAQNTAPQTPSEPEQAGESHWLLPEADNGRPIENMPEETKSQAHESKHGHGQDIAAKIEALELSWEGSFAPRDMTYDGTVRLRIEAHEDVRKVVEFLNGLWQEPHFRVLRVIGAQAKGDVEVWLELRQPLPLEQTLAQMTGVQIKEVSAENDRTADEPVVDIRLISGPDLQHPGLTVYAP